jgi:hypothetical protein
VGGWDRSAVTHGIALILVAALTVGLTDLSTDRLANQQTAREDRRDRREQLRLRQEVATEARGAARMLMTELIEAGEQMVILGGDHVLRRFDSAYRISIPDATSG